MKIEFSVLTNAELAQIIAGAGAELSRRMDEAPEVQRIPAPRAPLVIHEPPQADKEAALYIKAQLQRGAYIKAAERQRIAEIAATYPEWVQRQGLPTSTGTRVWRDAADRMSTRLPRER